MTVTVVSSVYGGYDQPAPPVPQTVDCEWVLVTDTPVVCPPWRVVVEPRPDVRPRLAAKLAKCRPDLYADADIYIWVDASFHIAAPDFVAWCVQFVDIGPLAQIPHPQRKSLTAEAEVSATMAKYEGLPVREQVAHYLKCGYEDTWGLWATGLIVRRGALAGFGEAWLAEQNRWTYQDQLSEPWVLFNSGIRPVDIPSPLWGDRRFTIRGHASHL